MRRERAEKQMLELAASVKVIPHGAVRADPKQLAHNNTYGILPEFYLDVPFDCIDCDSAELWTAKQQKWWYEIAKGHIDSQAVRCRECRNRIMAVKDEQKRHMEEMANRTPHPNESFFKSK